MARVLLLFGRGQCRRQDHPRSLYQSFRAARSARPVRHSM